MKVVLACALVLGMLSGCTGRGWLPYARELGDTALLRTMGLDRVDEHVELTVATATELLKKVPEFDVILTAESKGIPLGYELSRQDIAVMLARVLDKTEPSDEAFGDDAEISDYAKDAVYTLKNLGILNGTGDGSFEPKRAVTRAECAKIVYELIKE